VDDEMDNLELFTRVLSLKWKTYGWGKPPPIVTCNSPAKAIEAVEAHPHRFSVVISDYSMPVLNGIETCRAIRSINPSIHLCILSAYTPGAQRAKEKTVTFYSKPEDLEELYKKVREKFKAGPQKLPEGPGGRA
jgi:CheY-like chemotaxis protein